MLEEFVGRRVRVGDIEIATWTAGEGPPVVMLHGYPQNHVCWHRVAPALAETFTVVLCDLRGYGESDKPFAGDAKYYSKRMMAEDIVGVMTQLGHDHFSVVGHDRGGRVAYRMALDHPERVAALALLDLIPTIEQYEQITWKRALRSYQWYFLAQPADLPERLICGDRLHYLRETVKTWKDSLAEAMPSYELAYTPEMVACACADYRAGATIDVENDRLDREAGRRIAAPILVLFSRRAAPADLEQTWARWADNARIELVDSGHFIPEEAPEVVIAALRTFLGSEGRA